MDEKLTEGEYRVGKSFNPSADPRVDDVKAKVAELIDLMQVIAKDQNLPGSREAAIASTEFESAAMWAVKALTKPKRAGA